MKSNLPWIALAPVLLLNSAPALAAADPFQDAAEQPAREAFAGFQLRIGSTGNGRPMAIGRFGLSFGNRQRSGSLAIQPRWNAVELGFSRNGRTDLYVGGQPTSGLAQRLGLSSAGSVALAIGAVAIGGVVISQLADGDPDRERCWIPEGCTSQ